MELSISWFRAEAAILVDGLVIVRLITVELKTNVGDAPARCIGEFTIYLETLGDFNLRSRDPAQDGPLVHGSQILGTGRLAVDEFHADLVRTERTRGLLQGVGGLWRAGWDLGCLQ